MKNAFSLMELGVVLVITALLFVGVVQGNNMLIASRLAAARALTEKSIVPQISGLIAWYEPSLKDSFKTSESYDGARLSTWYDISPNSRVSRKNTLTRTANNQVTYESSSGANKVPSVRAVDGFFTLSSFYQGTLTRNTIFLVFQPIEGPFSSQLSVLKSASTGDENVIGISSDKVYLTGVSTTASTGTATNPASFNAGKDYILAAYFNKSSSKAYSNNAATMAGATTIDIGTTQMVGMKVGSVIVGGGTLSDLGSYLSEIIIYDRPLKTQERKDVMNYLSKKYQITVTGL